MLKSRELRSSRDCSLSDIASRSKNPVQSGQIAFMASVEFTGILHIKGLLQISSENSIRLRRPFERLISDPDGSSFEVSGFRKIALPEPFCSSGRNVPSGDYLWFSYRITVVKFESVRELLPIRTQLSNRNPTDPENISGPVMWTFVCTSLNPSRDCSRSELCLKTVAQPVRR